MAPTSPRASLLHQPTVNLRPSIAGKNLKEPLLTRFPDWRPIENPTYRFLDHDFYVERAKHFSTYDSKSWFSTLLLSVSHFSLTPVASYILLSVLLQIFRSQIASYVPHVQGVTGFMGGAASFLMVFRINNAYTRWFTGRSLWTTVMTLCYSAASSVTATMPNREHKIKFISELLAFPVALKSLLRRVDTRRAELAPVEQGGLMSDEQLQLLNEAASPPLVVLEALQHTMRDGYKDTGAYQGSAYVYSLNCLQGLTQAVVGCEMARAKVPRDYVASLRWFLLSWLFLLSFTLVGAIGWAAVPIISLISLLYLSMEEMAVMMDTPFGHHHNNICLEGYCLEIERILLDIMHRNCAPDREEGKVRRFGSAM